MRGEKTAILLIFILVCQMVAAGYRLPATAFAQEPSTTQTSEATEEAITSTNEVQAEQVQATRSAVQEANELVDELFIDRKHEKIKEDLVEAVINTAEVQVSQLTNEEEKLALQKLIAKARTQVVAKVTLEKETEALGVEKVIEAEKQQITKEKAAVELPKTDVKKKLTASAEKLKPKARTLAVAPVQEATKVNMRFEGFYLPGTDPNEVIKQEITNFHPKIGDEVLLRFNWDLLNSNHGYQEGQQFTFKLPANFVISQYIEGKTNDLGNFAVDTSGNVTLTLTKKVEGTAITDGYLQINAKFKKVSTNELEQKIDFGQYGGLKILLFSPQLLEKAPTITKAGAFYRDPLTGNTNAATINPDGINWTVTMNSEMANLTNAVVSDVLPAGQELLGDIVATKSASPGLDGNPSTTDTSTINFTDFPIELGNIDSKVVLNFTTKTVDPQPIYENSADLKATLAGQELTKTSNKVILTPVNPVAILKSGKAANTSINWEVKANMNSAIKMGETFVLTDTLSNTLSDYQKYDANSVEVYEYGTLDSKGLPTGTGEKLTSGVDLSIDDTTKKMTVTIAHSTGKAYIIKYNTIKSKALTSSGDVTNKAQLNDAKNSTAEATVRLNESSYLGKGNGIKVSDGVVKWTITANKQADTVKSGSKIIDTLESRLDWPTDAAVNFKIKADDVPLLVNTDYTVEIVDKKATIEFKKDITEEIVIDYETKYTIDSSQAQDYKNIATFDGQIDAVSRVQTVSSKFTQIDVEKNNGSKTGSYNLDTEQFDWKVIVNNNQQSWTNAKFTDTLPKGHELVPATFKVDDVVQNNVSSTDGELTYMLGNINSQLVITYSTKDSDQLLEEKNNINKVVITADNNISNTFQKNIVIETNNGLKEQGKGNAFVTKSPGANIGRTIPWTMTINASLSTLNHAVLTDATDGQQIFDPTSFKLTKSEVRVSANGVNVNWGVAEALTVGEHADYSLALTFDELGKPTGFKLIFKQAIKSAYKLEYKSKYAGVLGQSTENTADLNFEDANNITLTNTGGVPKKVVMTTSSGGATAVSKANLKIVKKDDSGKLLKGVEFTLYNFDGTRAITKANLINPLEPIVVKGMTDANGEVFFNDLPVDEYIVKETGVLPGYTVDSSQTAVDLTANKIIAIENTKIPMCLPLITVGKNTNHLTTLEIWKKDGVGGYEVVKTPDGKVVTAKIDSNGKVTLPSLDAGDYKFALTAQDKLNNKFSHATNFKVTEKGSTTCETLSITFDVVECATFDIQVVNPDGSALERTFIENSKFNLIDTADTTKVIKNITINAQGQLINEQGSLVKDTLKKGQYSLVQTLTPIGYKAIVKTISVTDTADICLASITLTAVPIACLNYSIRATDEAGLAMTTATAGYSKYVEEAQFTLTSSRGTTFTGVTIDEATGNLLKADKTEVATADLDAQASYTLVQENTVLGYTKLPVTPIIASLTDCLATVNVANAEIDTHGCTAFDISIKNTNGEILNTASSYYERYVTGAEFKLISSNSTIEPITQIKINAEGKLIKANGSKIGPSDLKAGEYTLIQTKTPPGFTPVQTTVIPNGIDCSAYAVINLELTTNPIAPGITCPAITINYNGPAHSQAEFKLVKKGIDAITGMAKETAVLTEIKVVTDSTTKKQKLALEDSTGEVITALEAGTYKIVQTKAHPGYQKTSALFTVKEGVCLTELKLSNVPIPPLCTEDTIIHLSDEAGAVIRPNNKAVVTVNGKVTSFKVVDDTIEITDNEISKTKESNVMITLDDGRSTTTVLAVDRLECTVHLQVPVLKLSNQDSTVAIVTTTGKKIAPDVVKKVTVNGLETPIVAENGVLVIPSHLLNPTEETIITVTLKDGKVGTVMIPKFTEESTFIIVINESCVKARIVVKVDGKAKANLRVNIVERTGKILETAKTDKEGSVKVDSHYLTDSYKATVTLGKETKSYILQQCITYVNLNAKEEITDDKGASKLPKETAKTKPANKATKLKEPSKKNTYKPIAAARKKTYIIYDASGKLIRTDAVLDNNGKVNLTNLPAGHNQLVSNEGGKVTKVIGKKATNLPQTGTKSWMLYTDYGMLSLSVSLWLLVRHRKKRTEKLATLKNR